MLIEMPSSDSLVPARSQARLRLLDNVMEFGLMALLFAAVLAFGAVRPWGIFGLRMGAALLFSVWTLRQVVADELQIPSSFLPLLVLGIWIGSQWIAGLTVYRYQTGQAWLTSCSYFLLMLPVSTIATQPARVRRFLLALAAFGTALAIFAMVQDVSGTKSIYWLLRPSEFAVQIYGPYVNRNHYAGLMELLTPLPFLLCLAQRPERRVPLISCGLLMALSVFLCRSRGGMVALAAELVFVAVFLSRIRNRAKSFAAIAAIVAIMVVLIVWVGSDPVVHRLTDMRDMSRMAVYKDTVRMWWSKPLVGYGAGVFPLVFPTFQSFVIGTDINHAHNEYLELLSETGLIGAGLLAWFLVTLYRRGNRLIRPGSRSTGSPEMIAVLAGLTGLLVHGLVDFNFHIPANAAFFLVYCAVAATVTLKDAAELHTPERF